MSLEVLQWSKESREDVNFVMEGKVYFNQVPVLQNVFILCLIQFFNSANLARVFYDQGSML